MKKIILLLSFLFLSNVFADDIKELEIEGFSIGDSLLDHMTKEDILSEIEINKAEYNYLTDEFGEVYLYKKYKKYDYLSFFVKPKDKNYLIHYIGATITYNDKIKKCLIKQKEIKKKFSSQFNFTKEENNSFEFPWDPTGKSKNHYFSLFLESGSEISVSCSEYEKSLKIKNKWKDGLTVEISTKEVSKWFRNHIN